MTGHVNLEQSLPQITDIMIAFFPKECCVSYSIACFVFIQITERESWYSITYVIYYFSTVY